jgi:hypothetical protein
MTDERWVHMHGVTRVHVHLSLPAAKDCIQSAYEGCETEWEEVQVGILRGVTLWKGCGRHWRDTGHWLYRFSPTEGAQAHDRPRVTVRKKRPLPAWRA